MNTWNQQGALGALSPQLGNTSFYTYGVLPPEIWPARNPPPEPQYQQDEDSYLLGDDPQTQALAEGGMPDPGMAGALGALPDFPGGQVQGPGTGRSDDIDARLSDGEYVLDAETVALLGDGSTEAGARALDQMREAIRQHKGQALAEGKFSPDAKSPLEYLMMGED